MSTAKEEAIDLSWTLGPPTFDVLEPGNCQFDENWKKVELVERTKIAHNVIVFTFRTPDGKTSLNLPTCSCILAKGGKDAEGNDIVRPYTPVTSNNIWGRFSLIIKIYPDGAFGKYISNCRVGDEVEFKQIPINVKIQYPFGKKKYYGMLVGGTGITPMVQALHALLGNEKDTSQINMLLGNQTEDDILCDKVLKSWTLTHGEQFDVTHVLSSEPEDSTWTGERGFITKELIEKHFASPTEDVLIFVCGPPQMYDAFCGPRDERDKLSGILSDMGYSVDQVYKF